MIKYVLMFIAIITIAAVAGALSVGQTGISRVLIWTAVGAIAGALWGGFVWWRKRRQKRRDGRHDPEPGV